jgi:hypothetical protein
VARLAFRAGVGVLMTLSVLSIPASTLAGDQRDELTQLLSRIVEM